MLYADGSQCVGLRPVLFVKQLEIQLLGSYCRMDKSEILGMGPSDLFQQALQMIFSHASLRTTALNGQLKPEKFLPFSNVTVC